MIFIDWLITREWLLRIFVNMTFLQKKNLCKQPTRIFGGFSFEQNLPSRRHWLTRQRSMRASSRILFVLTFLISCKATLSTPLSSSVNFSTFTYLTENVNSFLCEKANIQKTYKIGQKKKLFHRLPNYQLFYQGNSNEINGEYEYFLRLCISKSNQAHKKYTYESLID